MFTLHLRIYAIPLFFLCACEININDSADLLSWLIIVAYIVFIADGDSSRAIHLPFDMYDNVEHTGKCSSSSDDIWQQRPRKGPATHQRQRNLIHKHQRRCMVPWN